MGNYRGTAGDDGIVGSSEDDRFFSSAGQDTIEGGAGRDYLEVDYSAQWPAREPQSWRLNWDGSQFSGTVGADAANSTTFSGIEGLAIGLSAGDDSVEFTVDGARGGSKMLLDAGKGRDSLTLVMRTPDLVFDAGSGDDTTTNTGALFRGFEQYRLSLSGGSNQVTTAGGNDVVMAGVGRNTIVTSGGDDLIVSRGGVDFIDGGGGGDTWALDLAASKVATTLNFDGASGRGSTSNGTIVANVERMAAVMGAGADVVNLSRTDATVDLGGGNDRITLNQTSDASVFGGDGRDMLVVDRRGTTGGEKSRIAGLAASYSGTIGEEAFTGFENVQVYLNDSANELVVGNPAVALGKLPISVVAGTSPADILGMIFADAATGIRAVVGDDNVMRVGSGQFAGFERFAIVGGRGDDTIIGSAASPDLLLGGDGADILTGGLGYSLLDGGAGDDRLAVMGGLAYLKGGPGDDTYVLGQDVGGVSIIEAAGEGSDTVVVSTSYTLPENVERLVLRTKADPVGRGNGLANTIVAEGGNAALFGLDGNDTLLGAAGDDRLAGGPGLDRLTGGEGRDTFVLDVLESSANRDVIVDFDPANDRIALDRGVFGALGTLKGGGLDPASFVVGARAVSPDQRIIYNDRTGGLFYDSDGSGKDLPVQLAVLVSKPALTAEHFVVIG